MKTSLRELKNLDALKFRRSPFCNGLATRLNGFEKEWAEELKSLAWPNRSDERWRYTALDSLLERDFEWPQFSIEGPSIEGPSIATEGLESELGPLKNAVTILGLNGEMKPLAGHSWQGLGFGLGLGLGFEGLLAQAPEELVKKVLSLYTRNRKTKTLNPFVTLADCLLNRAFVVSIKKSVKTTHDEPLLILDHLASENMGAHAKIFIVVEEGAEAHVLMNLSAHKKSFTNMSTEVLVEKSGRLVLVSNYSSREQTSEPRYVYHQLWVDQAEHSSTKLLTCSMGDHWDRHDINVELRGDGARSEVRGVYFGSGELNRKTEHITKISHHGQNTVSRQLYKGIMAGSSRAYFMGTIHITRSARFADAAQMNKNLLLSPKAQVNTKPQLLIDNDEVKATHGATLSKVRSDELFYLQSRGIAPSEALHIIANGFAEDVLSFLDSGDLKSFLRRNMNQGLLKNGAF